MTLPCRSTPFEICFLLLPYHVVSSPSPSTSCRRTRAWLMITPPCFFLVPGFYILFLIPLFFSLLFYVLYLSLSLLVFVLQHSQRLSLPDTSIIYRILIKLSLSLPVSLFLCSAVSTHTDYKLGKMRFLLLSLSLRDIEWMQRGSENKLLCSCQPDNINDQIIHVKRQKY